MILIGYSGHAYVVVGIFNSMGIKVSRYCDKEEKKYNPFNLTYCGEECSEMGLGEMNKSGFFIAIGENSIRSRVYDSLAKHKLFPINAIHSSAVIDKSVQLSDNGVMVAGNVTINPLSKIGTGVICNTGCVIDHECIVEDFAHIGPGAVLCGNVRVGKQSFVGANAVVRQGITIGNNVMIGAGAVVVKDVPDNVQIVGNPARG
jgi:sugar O-acyltransferase (sialic acid O-acetyltransferase NeuD family)